MCLLILLPAAQGRHAVRASAQSCTEACYSCGFRCHVLGFCIWRRMGGSGREGWGALQVSTLWCVAGICPVAVEVVRHVCIVTLSQADGGRYLPACCIQEMTGSKNDWQHFWWTGQTNCCWCCFVCSMVLYGHGAEVLHAGSLHRHCIKRMQADSSALC
jgi:hypothetical protein